MTDPDSGVPPIDVRRNPEKNRFEIWVGKHVAGFTDFRASGSTYALTHTQIDSRFEGRGLGSILVRSVLDSMRTDELSLLPYCPYVRAFLDRHPEYVDLVPTEQRAEFGLAT